MLRSFGIRCEEHPDGFTVHGVPDGPWKPGAVDAAGDHRIAMAGAVAALIAGDASHVADAGNVATSYPGFAAALGALGATVTVR
jgi:3-phosphoshikimate 1-carboxyvinyltransferase